MFYVRRACMLCPQPLTARTCRSLSTYQALRYKNIKVVLINPAFVDTQMSRAYPGV